MPTLSLRWRIVSVSMACLGMLGLYLGVGGSRKTAAQQPPKAEDLGKALFYGVDSCRGCHTQKGAFSDDFVLLNEYQTWRTQDKHSLAYLVLLGERGQQMGKLLKVDVTNAEAGCLSCHAMNFPENRQGQQFNIKDGVSCDGCHGPAQHWIGLHIQPKLWRDKLSPEEKEAYGMFNVRDPIKRSQMCLSCHVGNVAEGKVVTHAMYAAGHPPLPPVEVATFSKNLPPHWRDLKDVPYLKDKAQPEVHKLYKYPQAAFEQRKLLLGGSLTAFAESMNLVASRANLNGRDTDETKRGWPPPWIPTDGGKDPKKRWPELVLSKAFDLPDDPKARWPELALAHSDCYACHHELTSPSWRQERGYRGKPGRPPVRSWSMALLSLGIQQSGVPATARELEELHAACSTRPFGDPPALSKAAKSLDQWANQTLGKVNFDLDEAATRKMLRELMSLPFAQVPDYESARQIASAIKVLYEEWNPKSANDAKIRAILRAWKTELNLHPYSGRADQQNLITEAAKALAKEKGLTDTNFADIMFKVSDKDLIETLLKKKNLEGLEAISNKETAESLKRMSEYDPRAFKEQLKQLHNLLPKPQ